MVSRSARPIGGAQSADGPCTRRAGRVASSRSVGVTSQSHDPSGSPTPPLHPVPAASPSAVARPADARAIGRLGQEKLPPQESELIEILVDAAIRKRQPLLSVQELEGEVPVTVAIRTAPIEDDDRRRVLGATWVMTQLGDSPFADRSMTGYRLAAGLALGGVFLALLLTAGLWRTVRRQSIERDRLQTELRRSERLAALAKLLAGVAHEIRNPLAGIRCEYDLHP